MRTGRFRFVTRRVGFLGRLRVQVLEVEVRWPDCPGYTGPSHEWIEASPSDAHTLVQRLNGTLVRS